MHGEENIERLIAEADDLGIAFSGEPTMVPVEFAEPLLPRITIKNLFKRKGAQALKKG